MLRVFELFVVVFLLLSQCVPQGISTTSPTSQELTCSSISAVDVKVNNTGFAFIHGKLKLGGNNNIQLVDQHGDPIQLVGMSSHGIHWFPNCYTKESIEYLISNWGTTVFRVAFYIGENGYATDNSLKAKLIDLVNICEALGIYVIIDWHVLNPGDPNYWLTGAGASQANAVVFWEEMATLFKNKNHVLYEIANEPNGVQWSAIKSYADTVISAIRAIDSETIIIVGTPKWSQQVDKAAADPVSNPHNVMYTFHFYSGTHKSLFSRVETYADIIPIFITEWGTSDASGDNGPYLHVAEKFLGLFAEKNISWTQWSYSDKAETSAALTLNACSSKSWDSTSCSGTFTKNFIKTRQLIGNGIIPNNSWGLETMIGIALFGFVAFIAAFGVATVVYKK